MLGNNIVDGESLKKKQGENKILSISALAANRQICYYRRRADIAVPSSAIEASAIIIISEKIIIIPKNITGQIIYQL